MGPDSRHRALPRLNGKPPDFSRGAMSELHEAHGNACWLSSRCCRCIAAGVAGKTRSPGPPGALWKGYSGFPTKYLCIRMLISLYSRSPLVQRRGRKGFLRAGRGIAGLALLQAGVQWRLSIVCRAIALFLGYVPSWVTFSSDAAYADCRNASAGIVALLR